jgi:inhibitor of KinA
VEIPVLYDPLVAPDLEALAAEKGLSVHDLAAAHASGVYWCALLGFRPGFPFLGGLDRRLHAARLATPRVRVAAGSVGIGGQQTGVYPVESPGGWRLIGRTPVRLFTPEHADPFLVHPGDAVRFVAVDADRYQALGGIFPRR